MHFLGSSSSPKLSFFFQKKYPLQRCAKAEEFEHVSLVKIFRLGETSVGISLAGVVWCGGYFCSSGLARFGFFKVRTLEK